MPKQTGVFAARAAGIMPLGFIGTVAEFHDLDAFRADDPPLAPARLYRRHRSSIRARSRSSTRSSGPSAEEVDHARRVVAAYDKALAEGVGAVTVDGKMIDVPVVERAQLLLEREAAIAAREARRPVERRTAARAAAVDRDQSLPASLISLLFAAKIQPAEGIAAETLTSRGFVAGKEQQNVRSSRPLLAVV